MVCRGRLQDVMTKNVVSLAATIFLWPAIVAVRPAQGADPDRVIYMVIQADPTTTASEIKSKFDTARKETNGCTYKDCVVEPIAPEAYLTLRSIVTKGLATMRAAAADTKEVLIEPLKGEDGAWHLDFGTTSKYLDAANVTVENVVTQTKEIIQMSVASKDQLAAPLRFHSPGSYVLRLPKGKVPRSAVFSVSSDNSPEVKQISIGWPDVGRCYLVTLNQVVGAEGLLFDTLKNEKKVANPIRELQDAGRASLMIASFREVVPGPVFLENGFVLRFPKPDGVNPKRIWMLFPLTENEERQERMALDSVLAKEAGFERVPELIRRSKSGDKLMSTGKTSGWLEIPWVAEKGLFEREITIDTAGWRKRLLEARATMGDHAIMVYEFESGDGTAAPIKMRQGYYVPTRIPEWLFGLQ
ncbi:MAG: hypothetical protein WCR23_12880 [Planctomycetota bacterium]